MAKDRLKFHQSVCLGKQHARHDKRALKLATYVEALAPAPADYALTGIPDKTPTLYDNDTVGDCTKAAYAGMIFSLSTAAGKPFNYTDDQVLQMYEECDGYKPGDEDTDNGSDGLTTLKYLTKSGAFGHAPQAYLSIDKDNPEEWKLACRYFGGVYIGVALPKAWQGSTEWGTSPLGLTCGKWAPWSWGGHMIYGQARYTPDYLEILTWAETYRMTWKAVKVYPDEAYALVVPDFRSPDGFDDVRLQQDLNAIRS
jgi:hypothetical protein